MQPYIVIAAFNEEKNIGTTIAELQSHGYRKIVVVDDGSRDGTAAAARKAKATVVAHPINRGQGAALRTGIEYALSRNAKRIVTFDADGQHDPEDIPKLLAPIDAGTCHVTLGSRFLVKSGDIPLSRRILLKGSVLIIFLFYGALMSDAHNGIRAMTDRAARAIEIRSDRMEHASEIIDHIVRKKIPYKEIPVTIRYTSQSLEKGEGSYMGAIRVLRKMILRKFIR